MSTNCLSWCISQLLSHPHNADAEVQTWLSSDIVTEFVISVAEREVYQGNSPELSSLLKGLFGECNEGGEFTTHIVDWLS